MLKVLYCSGTTSAKRIENELFLRVGMRLIPALLLPHLIQGPTQCQMQ
jgi:hypothetical protein